MKTVSADEIAAALDITPRSARRRADREAWKSVKRRVQGGFEKLYVAQHLPEDVRLTLARHGAASVLLTGTPAALAGADAGTELYSATKEEAEKARIAAEAQLVAFAETAPEKQEIAYARRDVLKARDGYLAASGIGNVKQGTAQFCRLYNSGEIRIADHIRRHVEQVSWSTLARWQAALRDNGLPGLVPGYHNPKKGATGLTPEQQDHILAMFNEHPHVKFSGLLMSLEARFPVLPGMNAIRRFVNNWKEKNSGLLLYCTNPDAWRNKKQFALGDASEQVLRLNQEWQFDSTPADIMLADGRYCLVGVIDVFSRRFKLHVSKTSRSTAVAALIRRALLDWGVPETAKTDNGADYVSRHIVQVFEAMAIEQVLCPPFTPEAKPHIERAFKTFAHSFQELMPGYIGHSVADRKDIEARKSFASRIMEREQLVEINMTAEELQVYCDRWCRAIYHQNRHRSLNNRTPDEVARAWRETVRRVGNERALDILLAEAPSGGARTVTKTGVSVDNITYISADLPEVGTTVRVKIDTIDLGTIYLFDAESGAFLSVAQDPLRTGIDRAETAAKIRHTQKKLVQEGQRELRRIAKEQALDQIHEEILASRESKIANIIDLPRPSVPYTTPALDEAVLAAEAMADLSYSNRQFDAMLTRIEEEALESAARVMKREEKVVLLRSDADTYDQIRLQTKGKKRPLTQQEYEWLTEYYDTNSGRMYMNLEGDLRENVGVASTGMAEA